MGVCERAEPGHVIEFVTVKGNEHRVQPSLFFFFLFSFFFFFFFIFSFFFFFFFFFFFLFSFLSFFLLFFPSLETVLAR